VGDDILINSTGIESLTLEAPYGVSATYSGSIFNGDVSILNNTNLDQLQLSANNISGTVYLEGSYGISFLVLGGIGGNLTIINANPVSMGDLSWVGGTIRASTQSLLPIIQLSS
jgi:hypothetical protein